MASTSGKHTFFKIFLWFYAANGLMVIYKLFPTLKDGASIIYFLATGVITLFCAIGIYLYAFEKEWLPAFLWKLFFFIYCADFIYEDFKSANVFTSVAPNSPERSGAVTTFIFLVGVLTIFFLPSFIALYKYAFKRKF